jgi:hypothetical protein
MIFFKGEPCAARPAAQPDLSSCFFNRQRTVAFKAQRFIFFFIRMHNFYINILRLLRVNQAGL